MTDPVSEPEDEAQAESLMHDALCQMISMLQDKLHGPLGSIVTNKEREELMQLLHQTGQQSCQSDPELRWMDHHERLLRLKKLFTPLQRRLLERHLALRNFNRTMKYMRDQLRHYPEMGLQAMDLSTEQVDRLQRLLDEYSRWFEIQNYQAHENPDEYAMRTAQLAAHLQALEVAWDMILDGEMFALVNETAESMENIAYETISETNHECPQDATSIRTQLHAFIGEMKAKLSGPLSIFVTALEEQKIMNLLMDSKRWLDETIECTDPEMYANCFKQLRIIEDLIQQRFSERVRVIEGFSCAVKNYQRELDRLRAESGIQESPDFCFLQKCLDQCRSLIHQQEQRIRQPEQERQDHMDESRDETRGLVEQLNELHEIWNDFKGNNNDEIAENISNRNILVESVEDEKCADQEAPYYNLHFVPLKQQRENKPPSMYEMLGC